MRTIGVVTTSRADYGIYRPVLSAIESDADLTLRLFVSGMHLSAEFGLTVEDIKSDGFKVHEQIESLVMGDGPECISKSLGLGVIGFSKVFNRSRPDILVVLGDRFDMYPAALAALPFKIPVAHIHGGEVTSGVIDDALRHSITKLSHLHFVSAKEYAHRVIQLGEEPWRVTVSGSPSLDTIEHTTLLSNDELASKYDLIINRPPLLVTYHPVTLEYEQTNYQITELLRALDRLDMPIIFTSPNADTSGSIIHNAIEEFVGAHSDAQFVMNLGSQAYFSLMAKAGAMVGNSSSGIIEAASFGLPVVNIGSRQDGRIRGGNVIDVGYDQNDIFSAVKEALSPRFRIRLKDLQNPYGSGAASEIIINRLRTIPLDQRLIYKRFFDVEFVNQIAVE